MSDSQPTDGDWGGGNVPLVVEIKDDDCICNSGGWKGKYDDEKRNVILSHP